MKFNTDYKKDNEPHSLNPKIGDYWHEMYCPQRVVVDVSDYAVVCCEATKDAGDNKWTWDIDKPLVTYTRDQFAMVNKSKCGKYWYNDVSPEGHKWVREYIDANRNSPVEPEGQAVS